MDIHQNRNNNHHLSEKESYEDCEQQQHYQGSDRMNLKDFEDDQFMDSLQEEYEEGLGRENAEMTHDGVYNRYNDGSRMGRRTHFVEENVPELIERDHYDTFTKQRTGSKYLTSVLNVFNESDTGPRQYTMYNDDYDEDEMNTIYYDSEDKVEKALIKGIRQKIGGIAVYMGIVGVAQQVFSRLSNQNQVCEMQSDAIHAAEITVDSYGAAESAATTTSVLKGGVSSASASASASGSATATATTASTSASASTALSASASTAASSASTAAAAGQTATLAAQ